MTAVADGTLWIVVEVERGIPTLVEAFHREDWADQRADELRSEINPEDDEVAVFEVAVR